MATLHILAGPNGAGKSTLYFAQLRSKYPGVVFVNADRLAGEFFGHHAATENEAKKGQELAESLRAALMAAGKSLITESTFSHRSKLDLIREAKELGYKIAIYHVNVSSAEVSIDRVQTRVGRGGHDVPEDRIRGRYERNKALIKEAILMADRGRVFDNSNLNKRPEMVLQFEHGKLAYASEHLPGWVKELYADQLEYLDSQRMTLEARSVEQARQLARALLGEESKTYVARLANAYRGEIIGQTSLHTLQQISKQSVVAHLTAELDAAPNLAHYATIEYKKSAGKKEAQGVLKATVIARPARAVAFETEAEADAIKRFPELRSAYEIIRHLEAKARAQGSITDSNAEQFGATLKAKMLKALNEGKLPKR